MSNKSAREKLIQMYGAECFIEKLGLRKFDEPIHYTSRGQEKKMKQLSYHHIFLKKNGGKATVENGAILSVENHIWFHKQSEESQRKMNQAFQEYKKCSVKITDDIPVSKTEISFVELQITDKIVIKPFNRAKVKEETRKAYEKYLEEEQEV